MHGIGHTLTDTYTIATIIISGNFCVENFSCDTCLLLSTKIYHLKNLYWFTISLMVVGHSAHSSSSSRPFDFCLDHPLITTDPAVGVNWSDLDLRSSVRKPRYALESLFNRVNFSWDEREHISRHEVRSSGNVRRGKSHAIAWVKCLINQHNLSTVDGDGLAYESDLVVPALQKGLVPFS